MSTFTLTIELLTDTTLGRGDGVAGLVDMEVQHDEWGCPYLGGRTLKGILAEECDNLLFALHEQGSASLARWTEHADRLYGRAGSRELDSGSLRLSRAQLPAALRLAIRQSESLKRLDVLDALTSIRHQTAIDHASGAPLAESLRAVRVLTRGLRLEAYVELAERDDAAHEDQLTLLAVCVAATRRVGTGRNRGVGAVHAALLADDSRDLSRERIATFGEAV